MALSDLSDWLLETSGPEYIWYIKRLSGNDTLANGSHQAGPYLRKDLFFNVFPGLREAASQNPDTWIPLSIDSHCERREVRVVWYNNKFHSAHGTRNETRITNLGGESSPLLHPDSTGSLAVFAFKVGPTGATECRVWVCDYETEADLVEERVGPVEPGRGIVWYFGQAPMKPERFTCWLEPDEIPPEWLVKFPRGAEIIEKAIALRPLDTANVDDRLLKRRECEFELFQSVEEAVELPLILRGFPTIGDFIERANSILQRRKNRSGKSLELHVARIFEEEGLKRDVEYAYQPSIEGGKRPDFLFPSVAAYNDSSFPAGRLRMLAVKTTIKDRWRQILNEAARVERKHLVTLQEGVSENQFREISEANVQLVVPAKLMKRYPASVRPYLQTVESFLGDVRHLSLARA